MPMVKEIKILGHFQTKTIKVGALHRNSQYLAFASKLMWLHLTVTPFIGNKNEHRIIVCKQCLISLTKFESYL